MTEEQREQAFVDAGGEREFQPQFGDTIRGIWAGDKNPIRDGFYLRTTRSQGRRCYELTDRNGKFWEFPAENTVRIAKAADAAQAFAIADEAMMEAVESEGFAVWSDNEAEDAPIGYRAPRGIGLDAFNAAVAWLLPRGYVELASDEQGEYIRVIKRPGEAK